MDVFNICLTGVGGQGIGLLSEIILRAADYAGHEISAVDTHGLAQRGGSVVSQVRLGAGAHSPLIAFKKADLAIALERHEALRALVHMAKDGGCLVYYDTSWQPLPVRLGQAAEVSAVMIDDACRRRDISLVRVRSDDLPEARMQNMAVLARICQRGLIPGLSKEHYLKAMEDLMAGEMLKTNRAIFEKASGE